MASGKLSPRQKMINLMYLVFIAMLALNMSKEVLTGFGIVNETVEASNVNFLKKNETALEGLRNKAKDAPEQFDSIARIAEQVSKLSSEYYNYLGELKKEFEGTVDDPKDYESMDRDSYVNEKFIISGKLTESGNEFLDRMENYRNQMVSMIGSAYPDVAENVKNTFKEKGYEIQVDNKKVPYIDYHFVGYPLISTITKLSALQNNIKINENEVLSQMFSGQLVEIASMDNYSTLLQSERSAIYTGDKFDGHIVLGRTDETTVPSEVNISLDGKKLVQDQDFTIEGGQVVLNVVVRTPGEHKIEGELVFNQEGGEDIIVSVDQSFQVIPKPNEATVSADKMNVVYRGIDNPITVSMAGISENNLSVDVPGHTKTKVSSSKYIIKPGAGKELTVRVAGKIDGETVTDEAKFRIKALPRPTPTIRGQIQEGGAIKLPRKAVEISPIGAIFEDFDFDLSPVVKRFTMSVPGQASVVVNGATLNAQAKKALNLARTGDIIQFFDIKADIPGAQVNVKNMPALLVQLTN